MRCSNNVIRLTDEKTNYSCRYFYLRTARVRESLLEKNKRHTFEGKVTEKNVTLNNRICQSSPACELVCPAVIA